MKLNTNVIKAKLQEAGQKQLDFANSIGIAPGSFYAVLRNGSTKPETAQKIAKGLRVDLKIILLNPVDQVTEFDNIVNDHGIDYDHKKTIMVNGQLDEMLKIIRMSFEQNNRIINVTDKITRAMDELTKDVRELQAERENDYVIKKKDVG